MLAAVGIVTSAALVHHVQNDVIGWEETTEVPLMTMVFLAMAWHAQRRFVRFASHELRTPLTVARVMRS